MQAARSREKKDGRPNKMEDKVAISIKMYKSMDYTMKEITETTGISKTTLYRYLNRAATL
ncbi:helix-turn-helix domain-containing protein [Bacillus thuringiensis]